MKYPSGIKLKHTLNNIDQLANFGNRKQVLSLSSHIQNSAPTKKKKKKKKKRDNGQCPN